MSTSPPVCVVGCSATLVVWFVFFPFLSCSASASGTPQFCFAVSCGDSIVVFAVTVRSLFLSSECPPLTVSQSSVPTAGPLLSLSSPVCFPPPCAVCLSCWRFPVDVRGLRLSTFDGDRALAGTVETGAYGVGSQAPMGHLGQPFSGGYLAQSSPFWASGLSLCSGT